MPRLRDRADVLIPQRLPDPNTGTPRIDWSAEPETIPCPFEGQQQRSGGGDLDEGTALASWSAWLPPAVRLPLPDDAEPDAVPEVVDLDARLHAGCRISWHDREYSIDGPIRRPRRGGVVQYLAFSIKLADRRPVIVP